MRIIYNRKKGKRYKCSSVKVNYKYNTKHHRFPIFCGVRCKGYWWVSDLNRWYKFEDIPKGVSYSSHCDRINNVKQFVRHLKQWKKYIPKGNELSLNSNFRNIEDIIGII